MSGASESNDDLVSGRVNRSNDLTRIWAENAFPGVDDLRVEFNGDVIFLVEVAHNTEEDGEHRPSAKLDAIIGRGWSAQHAGGSGGIGVIGIGGEVAGLGVRGEGGENGGGMVGDAGGRATGVAGFGGPNEGTGVFGLGSGGERLFRRGRGGIGVHGAGGHADLTPGHPPVSPGTGVFGEGGKILESNPGRLLLGAGVIGLGGHAGEKNMPSVNVTGSVGVFGEGADARVEKIFDTGTGTSIQVGPLESGAGVIGRGGLPLPPEMPVAAGVIGLAGGHSKPPIAITGNVGVFGLGPTGVRGRGDPGPGVNGVSDKDRGGVFESERAAQARLVPQKVRTRLPEGSPITPTGIAPAALENGVVSLPKDGAAGDLMTLIDDGNLCTLWFCVRTGGSTGPARWAQVILGTQFDGQAS